MDNWFTPGILPNTERGQSARGTTSVYHYPVRTKEKCTVCGFTKRGPNHDEGHHHKKDSNFVRRSK